LEIAIDKERNYTILKIKGDVDLYSSPQVRKQILALANKKHANILVDFLEVTYMDSSGVATLVEALQLTNKNGGKLRLFNLDQPIKDVFELSRLDRVFEIYDDESKASEGI
jgi:anti-sigma B factor antagonist